jgi:hypothetical protein
MSQPLERSASSTEPSSATEDGDRPLPVSGFKGTHEEVERQWYEQVYRGRGDSMRQLTWRVAWMPLGLSLGTRQARLRASVPV